MLQRASFWPLSQLLNIKQLHAVLASMDNVSERNRFGCNGTVDVKLITENY